MRSFTQLLSLTSAILLFLASTTPLPYECVCSEDENTSQKCSPDTPLPVNVQCIASLEELSPIHSSLILTDVDETIMMPNTSFIYGLSLSDRFTAHLQASGKYPQKLLQKIFSLMESRYYASPVMLVEGNETRNFVQKVKEEGSNILFGLTSRAKRAKDFWKQVAPHLTSLGIRFNTLEDLDNSCGPLPAELREIYQDGIFFAGKRNKGQIASQLWTWLHQNTTFGSSCIQNSIHQELKSLILLDNTPQKVRDFVNFLQTLKTPQSPKVSGLIYIKAHSNLSPTRMLFDFADIIAETL